MLPFNNTKTLMYILNELYAQLNVNPDLDKNTTLNTKYQIFQDELPTTFPPKIQYFGIGVNGFKNVDDNTGSIPRKPNPKNMDLYYPIPIRCVPTNIDLIPEERDKYRIRVLQVINGQEYWCYYLKKLEFLTSNITLVKTNLLTGLEESVDIEYTYLNPTPDELAVPDENDDTEEYNTYIDAVIKLTGEELSNTINVLYNGDISFGRVSEIGLYSGEDKVVTDDFGTSYTESIYTQLVCHECNTGVADFSNPAINFEKIIRITESTGFIL